MKVLFAVNDEKDAESITRVYQEEYKEIISSKTVYYFNAIIKELQKDKTYDRIVISEDLEMFSNNNYQAIDKFIFEKMDAISDEATNAEGNDIPIILLCVDRRTKNDPLLLKLFGLGLYNILVGQDRSVQKVCKLMYKPRTKKEAKLYYKVEAEDVNYTATNKTTGVNESEMQNILNHYKKIGDNIPKCVQSFESIASQYSKEQIKLIIQVLPVNVKVILEENSDLYRKIMGIKGKRIIGTSQLRKNEYVEKEIDTGSRLTKPVIIPTAVNTKKVTKIQSPEKLKREQERIAKEKAEAEARRKEQERIEKEKAEAEARRKERERIAREKAEAEARRKEQERIARERAEAEARRKEQERIAREKAEAEARRKEQERIAREKAEAEARRKEQERIEKEKSEEKMKEENNVQNVKRGRGRPRKNPVIVEEVPVKKKRGRPRKNPIIEEEVIEKVQEPKKEVSLKNKKYSENNNDDELINLEIYNEDDDLLNKEISEDDDILAQFDDYDEIDDEEDIDYDELDDKEDIDYNELDDEEDTDYDELDDEEDIDYNELDDEEDTDYDELDDEEDIDYNELDDEEDIDDDELNDEDSNMFPEFDDYEEDNKSSEEEHKLEDDEDTTLPGFDEDDDYDYSDDGLLDEEDNNYYDNYNNDDYEEDDELLDFDDEEDLQDDDIEESGILPGFDDEEDDDETELPGLDDEEDDDETELPGLDDEEDDDETELPEFDDEEENEQELPGLDEEDEIEPEETVIEKQHNGSFKKINNKNYKYDNNLANSIRDLQETEENTSYNIDTDNLITADQKVVSFVGTTKNGTSFIVNNLAELYSNKGIKTAILDLTKNKNSYYIYTNNEDELRETAHDCLEKLRTGIADGIKVNKNLSIFTSLPGEDDSLNDVTNIIQTLLENYTIVLLDCDFATDVRYFKAAQEIYLVQSLDVLTIQPLTAFLRDLKVKGILETNKLRIVINKNVRVNSITDKILIGGMSVYNDPGMTYMTELFDRDTIKYTTLPFEDQVYVKYLEGLVNCRISSKGYSKNFMSSLNKLSDMVYPTISGKKAKNKYNDYSKKNGKFEDTFSKNTSSTLDKMKRKY